MEELSLEEKAKRYDEAIKRAKALYDNHQPISGSNVIINNIFPELKESKESEDEKLKEQVVYAINQLHVCECTKNKLLTWLEKQCEQNPYSGISFNYNGHTWGMCARDGGVEILFDSELKAFLSLEKSFIYPIHPQPKLAPKSALEAANEEKVDNQNCIKSNDKVEPKFKVGDFIVNDYCMGKVIELTNDSYLLDTGQGIPFSCEHNAHLWTIQDAKDGDALFTSSTASHETFIFKNIDERGNAKCYFAYDSEDGFREGKYHFIGSATNCKPATKEQYDALMKAMADAGWEFDFEKKELKKIVDEEQIKKNLQDNSFRRMFEQKTTEWSEEDERMYRGLHNLIYSTQYCDSRKEFSDWLKFIKDRVQPQPQQEWSEEDEDILNTIINHFKVDIECTDEDDVVRWLKSLKARCTWKPSDEQLKSLKEVIDAGHFTSYPYALETLYEKLNSLYRIYETK